MTPAERLLLIAVASKALIPPAEHGHTAADQRIREAMHALDGEAAREHRQLRVALGLLLAIAVPGDIPRAEIERVVRELREMVE